MNDKEEFFDLPKKDDRNRPSARRRKRGFLTQFAWMVILGFTVLVLILFAVKWSGNGPGFKRTLITWLGGTPLGGTPQGGNLREGTGEASAADPDAPAQVRPDTPAVERIVEVPVEKIVEKVVEKIVEVEVLPPMPSGYVAWKKVDTAKLWSEIPVKTEVITDQGDIASKEREREESYQLEMTLRLTVPKPNQSVEELSGINSHLPAMLSDFETLVSTAEVSPFYHHLYELKTTRIQQNVTRIEELLSRHNLYDLETVLQIKHPESGRKLLLVQGEMDVVSDGSDGDRWPELDDYISMSQHYQPFTSYGWAKRSKVPNPLLSRWETQLAEYEKEFAIPGLSIERNRFLRGQIDQYKLEVADLRARSYLIAEADPFIVIPLSFLGRRKENEFGPAIGDYAVVVYGDKLYPAIAGDAGPSWKFGEASLRIARALNEKASPYNRPVSDLEVTYLIFPESAEETKGPPDLAAWHRKCTELLEEIGGLGEGYSLHQWEDLIAKKKEEEAAEAAAASEAPAPEPAEPGTEAADKKPAEETTTPDPAPGPATVEPDSPEN